MDSGPEEKIGLLEDGSKFARGIGNTSIAVFLLALMIPVRGLEALGVNLGGWPINSAAFLIIGLVGLTASSRWKIRQPLVISVGIALPVWLVLSTWLLQGDDAVRRPGSIIALMLGGMAIATGRIHLRSLIRGLTVGLILAAIASAVLALSRGERLGGLLGDANQAGFVIVTVGLLALQGSRRLAYRIPLFLALSAALILTLSRTSMFALLIGVLWALFGNRLPRWLGAIGLALAVPVYQWLGNAMDAGGWFSDREGSDELRVRLAIVEQQLVDEAGWLGKGLGTAIADMDGITLFFHNSYRAMQIEGGIVALVLLIAFLVGLYLMGGQLAPKERPGWAEGAVIAACICSFNIGFSITHPVFAAAVGCLIAMNAAIRSGVDWELQPVHIPRGVTSVVVPEVVRSAGRDAN